MHLFGIQLVLKILIILFFLKLSLKILFLLLFLIVPTGPCLTEEKIDSLIVK